MSLGGKWASAAGHVIPFIGPLDPEKRGALHEWISAPFWQLLAMSAVP